MNQHAPPPSADEPVNRFIVNEPTRMQAVVGKVSTAFGSCYCHVAFDASGHVREVRISYPGKHMKKEVGAALDAIGAEITNLMEGINGAE